MMRCLAVVGLALTLLLAPTVGQGEKIETGKASSGALVTLVGAGQLAMDFRGEDPAKVAEAIRDAAGIRIDGIEGLRGLEPIGFQFTSISVENVLGVLAAECDSPLILVGPGHYALGPVGDVKAIKQRFEKATACAPAGEVDTLKALHATWTASWESMNAEAESIALEKLLDAQRPKPGEPAACDLGAWGEAILRAVDRGDLPAAESLATELVSLVKHRDAGEGFVYANALLQLARIRGQQGVAKASREHAEQALALAEAVVGKVDVSLVPFQLFLAESYSGEEKFSEATELFGRAIDALGEPARGSLQFYELSSALNGLAAIHNKTGHPERAIPFLERNVALMRDAMGGPSMEAWLLGETLTRVGRFAEAEKALKLVTGEGSFYKGEADALLDAIHRLGPFAGSNAGESDLVALGSRWHPDSDVNPKLNPDRVHAIKVGLKARARLAYESGPASNDWRTSCRALAIISAYLIHAPGRYDESLRYYFKECADELRQPASP